MPKPKKNQVVTPQPQADKLARALGLTMPLYLKREDLHPLKSHKGRSLPPMIDHYLKFGHSNFVISSSGNAALAAGLYLKKINSSQKNKINLKIFVGKKIPADKIKPLQALTNKNITIVQVTNPKQSAFLAQKQGAVLLRQSLDNLAPKGYADLYDELRRIKELKTIFIPTSSGTTLAGLFMASKGKIQLNIVQTDFCHPFVKSNLPTPKKSLAGAIVDKVGHRKTEVLKALKKSKGAGYVADDWDIKNAIKLAYKTEKIKLSPNSALALVGLLHALIKGWQPKGAIALLITGK